MAALTEFSNYRIILASTSPRRQELLKIAGIPFITKPPMNQATQQEIDETPFPGESPAALVQRLSRTKAEASAADPTLLSSLAPPSLIAAEALIAVIIAADTAVAVENKILGKPRHAAEAVAMLQLLRQRPHHVYTGLTVARLAGDKQKFVTHFHQSTVRMRPYSDAEIAAYVDSGDPLDKAGAYGIQNSSFAPVARLEGCFTSVMGLPLGELAAAFKQLDLPFPEVAAPCSQHTGQSCCQSHQ